MSAIRGSKLRPGLTAVVVLASVMLSLASASGAQAAVPTAVVSIPSTQANPSVTAPVQFAVKFSAPVTGFETADATVGGTALGTRSWNVTGSGTDWAVRVSGMTGSGTVTVKLAANVVTGGNQASNSGSIQLNIRTVTINQAATQLDPTATVPVQFTVKFSAVVAGFDPADVKIAGTAPGTKTASITASTATGQAGQTYTVSVVGMMGPGTVTASVLANGVNGGNAASTSTDNSVQFNGRARTVTINKAAGQADPATTAPVKFTVTFSATVTGFTAVDVTLGGTAPGTKTATVTISGATATVSVSGMTGPGTVTATVPANVVDQGNTAATSTDNSVQFNIITVTINKSATQADPTIGSSIAWTITFSAPVTGLLPSEVGVGGPRPGFSRSLNAVAGSAGKVYTFSIGALLCGSAGTATATVAANVAAEGNAKSTSTDASVVWKSPC